MRAAPLLVLVFALALVLRGARGAASPTRPYVSWESFAGFNNQRQALEIALSVASCLGAGTRLALHDWRRSTHVVHAAAANASDPAAAASSSSSSNTYATPGGKRRQLMRATLSKRGSIDFDLLADTAHLAETARVSGGGVRVVPWQSVPPDTPVLRLRVSAFCHYSCAWVRREVARQCPHGAVCDLGPPAPPPPPPRAAEPDDVYSSVQNVVFRDGEDFYDDSAQAADADDAADATQFSHYYAESAEHVLGVEDGVEEVLPQDGYAADPALHEAAGVNAGPVRHRRARRRAVLVVPLVDWGSVEAIFSGPTVAAIPGAAAASAAAHPVNALRPSARVAALAAALLLRMTGDYAAVHLRLGDLEPYAHYNCRDAGALGAAPGAANATRAPADVYVRDFTRHGVACKMQTTGRLGGGAPSGYLLVQDVLRGAPEPYRVRGTTRLYIATNMPDAPQVTLLRSEALLHGVSTHTLDDLLARSSAEVRADMAALERDAEDAQLVRSLLDQQVCTLALAYVGTGVSTWDQYVLRERAARALARTAGRRAEPAARGADAAALADYALYVQHQRAWAATYECTNAAHPASDIKAFLFIVIGVAATFFVRRAHAQLTLVAGEAERRSELARSAHFVHAAPGAAGAVRPFPRRAGADAALATALKIVAFLVLVHSLIMMLLEPLALAAHLNGTRAGTSAGPNVVAVLSTLRALCLVAIVGIMTLEVCVRSASGRVVVAALGAGAAAGAYALSHVGMTAHDFAGALAPMPTLLLLAAFSLGAAFVISASAVAALRAALRLKRPRDAYIVEDAAAAPHTSAARTMAPNRVRAHVLALHIAAAVLALALRLFYISESWRLDDVLDLVRTSLEFAAAALAGSVLASNALDGGGPWRGGDGRSVVVSLRPSINGGGDAHAGVTEAYIDAAFYGYADGGGEAPFDACAAERASDRQLEDERLANTRLRGGGGGVGG